MFAHTDRDGDGEGNGGDSIQLPAHFPASKIYEIA